MRWTATNDQHHQLFFKFVPKLHKPPGQTRFILIWHCKEQRKMRCLERDSNSHLRVSRPPSTNWAIEPTGIGSESYPIYVYEIFLWQLNTYNTTYSTLQFPGCDLEPILHILPINSLSFTTLRRWVFLRFFFLRSAKNFCLFLDSKNMTTMTPVNSQTWFKILY